MRKVIYLMVLVLAGVMAQAADYERLSLNERSYIWEIVADTADTNASGIQVIRDTVFSDTFDIDDYKYLNVVYYLYHFDSGSVLDDDTTQDTLIANFYTSFGSFSPSYSIFCDTCVKVPCTLRAHLIVDTLVYNEFFVRTRIIDSLTPATVDTNEYRGWIDVLGGGSR